MHSQDRDYYHRRAREERERAEHTRDVTARRAHQEMAERYDHLATDAARAQLQPTG